MPDDSAPAASTWPMADTRHDGPPDDRIVPCLSLVHENAGRTSDALVARSNFVSGPLRGARLLAHGRRVRAVPRSGCKCAPGRRAGHRRSCPLEATVRRLDLELQESLGDRARI